jgi:4-aminobutyrate aminotransferase-like enzyme
MPTSPILPTHSIENATKVLIPYGVSFLPDIIVSANGVFLTTSTGRQLLDWTSGQMACILGHGNEEVAATIQTHTQGLGHLLSASISPPVVELATRLVSLLPIGLDRAMFLCTGSESCEAAIKLAKVFTGKWEIVGLGSSWHGMTGAAVSAQYHGGRKGFGPLVRMDFCN